MLVVGQQAFADRGWWPGDWGLLPCCNPRSSVAGGHPRALAHVAHPPRGTSWPSVQASAHCCPRTRPSPPFTQRAWLIPEGRCRCPPHPLPRLCRAQGHPRHHHRVVGWSLHHPDLNRSCPKSEIGPQSSIDHMAAFVTCVSCPGCHLCHLQRVQSFGATLAPRAFLHVP